MARVSNDEAGPAIAYIHGDTPPDFAAIAACGFTVVVLDSRAPWFDDWTVGRDKTHGLTVFAHPMGSGSGT
jgi:hypothetical protein